MAETADLERQEKDLEKAREWLLKFSTTLFDKALGYMTLFVSLGFAGFFTLWQHIEHYITYQERMVIAAFFTLSLSTFLGWQIFGAITMAKQQLSLNDLIVAEKGDLRKAIEAYAIQEQVLRAKILKMIWVVLGFTVGFAAIGAFTLALVAFEHLASGHR